MLQFVIHPMFSRSLSAIFAGLWLVCGLLSPGWSQTEEHYPLPPEAQKREGVPEGKVEGPFNLSSKIYPGTEREYWIYVPAQYTAAKPACSLIVQDGLNRAQGWNLPQIFDNLIHTQAMPVTIGIFVNPGIVPAVKEKSQPRFNRSFEYDSLGDRYARFCWRSCYQKSARNMYSVAIRTTVPWPVPVQVVFVLSMQPGSDPMHSDACYAQSVRL
jgi:hypothetical protein